MIVQRIIGIDPGTRIAGFGVIQWRGSVVEHIDSGSIHCGKAPLPQRLQVLYQTVSSLIAQHRPDMCVLEQSFVAKNPAVALKLGQARGVITLAVVESSVLLHELAPRQIKQAITGYGNASKAQVQFMVQQRLRLSVTPKPDAADALAMALAYAMVPENRDKGVA